MKVLVPVLVLAIAASGCASHYAMSEPRSLLRSGLIDDPVQAKRLEAKLTDKDIADLLDADIRAKVPTKLALAAVTESYAGWHYNGCGPATISAEELERWEKIVEGVPHIEGVQPISHLSLGGEWTTLHGLRTAAARMSCELLFVYYVSSSAVDNYNDAAALYWTFVGLWLAPGNTYEHRTVIQGIIVDCRTGAILGTATGDSHLTGICPAAYGEVQRAKLAKESHEKAMDDFLKGCKPVLKAIVARAEAPRQFHPALDGRADSSRRG